MNNSDFAKAPKLQVTTVRTRIIGPCATTVELPLLLRPGVFFFFFVSGGRFLVFFAPFPEEEISDYIAHGLIIRVLTVRDMLGSLRILQA